MFRFSGSIDFSALAANALAANASQETRACRSETEKAEGIFSSSSCECLVEMAASDCNWFKYLRTVKECS